jgi:hypothetical protein
MTLNVDRRRWFRRDLVDAARFDAEPIELGPERDDGLARISVEVATADTDELPASPFKIALGARRSRKTARCWDQKSGLEEIEKREIRLFLSFQSSSIDNRFRSLRDRGGSNTRAEAR